MGRLPAPNRSVYPLVFYREPRYHNSMENYNDYYDAAQEALANYLGTDDPDQDMINLVANCCVDAIAALPNESYFESLLEKSSTYVQTDLNELEMQSYVDELETQLVTYGLL